jgi:hypothetical protein
LGNVASGSGRFGLRWVWALGGFQAPFTENVRFSATIMLWLQSIPQRHSGLSGPGEAILEALERRGWHRQI